MQVLKADQIKHIEDRVALASIKNKSLTIDILDHICCMIEERLESGFTYKQAEKKAFSQMGILQIQAIEQETKILTQNKIIMKNRTKIIGLVAIALMAIGFGMKQLHLMGAAVTWGIGVLVAVFGFTLFLTVDRFKYEVSTNAKIVSITGYFGAASFLLGLGLKVLHWPIATDAMIIGGFILLIYFVASNSIKSQTKFS